MAEPFYRRLWWWTLVAPLLLALVLAPVAFLWRLSQENYRTLTFMHFTGSPDNPVYNLTDEQANRLPGNIPRLLTQAKLNGSASTKLAAEEFAAFEEETRYSTFFRYQGTLFKRDKGIVHN